MKTHAIVIGIDSYTNPAWKLDGAVRDAIAFARWADKEADLDPGGRVLLIAACPAVVPAGWRVLEPTKDNIETLLEQYRTPAVDRLVLFYAGHAITPPTRSPDSAPVLVPSTRADLVDIGRKGVDLAVELPLLLRGPALQLFFIDGCRDIAKDTALVTVGQQVTYNLANLPESTATQAVLFATRTGKWANELGGRGVFTRALLEGLSGRGPDLTVDGQRNLEMLSFHSLGQFVKERVAAILEERRVDARAIKAQIPTFSVVPDDAAPIVRSFKSGDEPRLNLRIRVEPAAARRRVTFAALQRNRFTRKDEVIATFDGGAPVTTLQSPSGFVVFRVEAPGFEPRTESLQLRGDDSLFVELVERSELEGAGLESLAAPPPAGGTLTVTSRDQHVRIVIENAQGEVVGTGRGTFDRHLEDGTYFVKTVLPGLPEHNEPVVIHGSARRLEVGLPVIRPGPVTDVAGAAGMLYDGYAHPAEHVNWASDLRLSSLLAYAAWGAAWRQGTGETGFYKLSHWGVRHAAAPRGRVALTVLVGDASREDTRIHATARCTVFQARAGASALPTPSPLTGVSFSAQTHSHVEPGSFEVRLDAGGLAPTTFACVAVEGFVTVLVVTREEWGDIEVGMFLVPVNPGQGVRGLPPPDPSDIRTHDLGARALLDGLPVLSGEYANPRTDLDPLVDGQWTSPIAAVVAGYRLWREGRLLEFEPSLNVLVEKFPELADLFVLDGLRWLARGDLESATNQLLRAVKGLPVVSMGFRELLRHRPDDFAVPRGEGVVPGTLWTTFAPLPRAIAVRQGRLDGYGGDVPGSSWNENVESALGAVGRIGGGALEYPYAGTVFLVAPDVVLTMGYVLDALTAGSTELPDTPLIVDFTAEQSREGDRRVARVVEIVPIQSQPREGRRTTVCALRLAEPMAIEPLKIARGAPRVGQDVGVVGHPSGDDARVPEEERRKVYRDQAAGTKFLIPGQVIAIATDGSTFDHDCFTLGGTAGACVIDLATGGVLGVHGSGFWHGNKKIGTAHALRPLLADATFAALVRDSG